MRSKKSKSKKTPSYFEVVFKWVPAAGILLWEVHKTGHPEIMHFVWPLIFLMIHDADEAFATLNCLCTLNRVKDGTNIDMPSKPRSDYVSKLFCSHVGDLPTETKPRGEKLDLICARIVKKLNEIGAREWDGVCLIII